MSRFLAEQICRKFCLCSYAGFPSWINFTKTLSANRKDAGTTVFAEKSATQFNQQLTLNSSRES